MSKTLIIAEIGVNHNGSVDLAKRMVEVAKSCGADVAKFQTFNVNSIASRSAQMAQYQKNNLGEEMNQIDMLKSLALSNSAFQEISDYCKSVDIMFLSTPFDIESIRFLNNLQDTWKIPSGEITNYPFLVEIARTRKRIILSTGMSTMDEVDDAVKCLSRNGSNDITLLHCTTEYPAPFEDVNLRAMLELRNRLNYPIGYSDHTKGIEISLAAVAMGATVIEKHLTLDRNMIGPDHKASIEPDEFAFMVKAIRNIEKSMGNGIKQPSKLERQNMKVARKSIIASKPITAGDLFSEDNLTTKRPGTGINPMRWNEVIGMPAKRNFSEDEFIEI